MKITRTEDSDGRNTIRLQATTGRDQDIINSIVAFTFLHINSEDYEYGCTAKGMNYVCFPTAPWEEELARIAAGDPEIVAVP